MKRFGVGAVVALFFWIAFAGDAQAAVDTHTIYLNNCEPGGCVVKNGPTNATTDTSDIGHGTLTAFSQSSTIWASVVSCMQTTFAAFDVTITETRPTSGDYFEVMIGGTYADLGLSGDTPATADSPCSAPGTCDPFIANALVFVFANDSAYVSDPNGICASAAEELANTWALDHVVDATDVMAFSIATPARAFHDGEACGGDCSGGLSPFGSACTGTGGNATHVCIGTNTATQDEVKTILSLFGAAPVPTADGGTGDDGGASADGGSTVNDAGSTTLDSGVGSDAGDGSDAGNDTSSSGSGDSGGCAVVRDSRESFSFAGFAFVIAAIALRRTKRRVSP
jgi:hypothetical protein